MRVLAAAAVMVLGACGALAPIAPAQRIGLVIANDSDAPVFWSLEQPTGEITRFTVEPCSSSSQSIDVDRFWEVEWGAALATSSDEVQPLDAAVTVVEVWFDAAGHPEIAPLRAAADQPDAPSDGFTCSSP